MSLFGRRERREIAELEAYIDRLRGQRDRAESRAVTAEYNRGQVLAQLAAADAANRRLVGRNLELGRRLSALAESDPEYAARLEKRLARALHACARWMDATWVETRHNDRLQARLDDACGLNEQAVEDGRHWQQTRSDRLFPKEAAS